MPSVTILVVEDERVIARDLQMLLHRLGYHVPEIVDTGPEAITHVKAQRPGLVLMDMRLRGTMDGIAAAEVIQQQFDVPVVYLTAFADDATRERAQRTAPYGYLVKPFDERTLQATIQMALARHALDRQHENARQIERLRVLAGGIAHDFNNLFAGVMGNAELARLDLPHESPAHQPLAQIAQITQRATDLTRQLRTYAGDMLIQPHILDMNVLLRQALASLPSSTLNRATTNLRLAPDLPSVKADAMHMHRAMQQLLTNATEAIGATDGTITITTERRHLTSADLATAVVGKNQSPGQYVAVEIGDTGCGMDNTTLAQMFDPFFTTKFIGRGLGLPMVLGIIRQHSGALTVQSTLRLGTTVTIFLAAVPT